MEDREKNFQVGGYLPAVILYRLTSLSILPSSRLCLANLAISYTPYRNMYLYVPSMDVEWLRNPFIMIGLFSASVRKPTGRFPSQGISGSYRAPPLVPSSTLVKIELTSLGHPRIVYWLNCTSCPCEVSVALVPRICRAPPNGDLHSLKAGDILPIVLGIQRDLHYLNIIRIISTHSNRG